MTKKEKKEEALRLKAAIEGRKPKPEQTSIISKEQMEKNNRKRYARRERPDDFVKWLRRKRRNQPGEL